MARDLKRLNLNIPTDLVNRIDEYSGKVGLTRSSAIVVLCDAALNNIKAIDGMGDLMEQIKALQQQSKNTVTSDITVPALLD